MRLYLFTNYFPLKRSEPFLANEFVITQRFFDSTVIFPLCGDLKDTTISSKSVKVLAPPIQSLASKKKLFWTGLFNTAPLQHHALEVVRKNLLFRPKAFYWHFVSMLIARVTINSRSYALLKKSLRQHDKCLLYFYWGDNLCWLLPYIYPYIPRNTKIIIRLHRTDLYENLKGDHAPLRKKIFSCADVIAPVSQHGVTYLKEKYPEFSDKIILSRLGVFDHGVNPLSDNGTSYTIVSVSSVVAVKRVKLLFRALQNTSINLHWHHFGDGPLLEDLRNEIRQKKTNLEITLHGFVDNSMIIDFYSKNAVHLFINVSESEGLPVSIMEALSFGIPVLATDAGGTGDIVDELVGSLVPVNSDELKFAGEIERLLVIEKHKYTAKRETARNRYQQQLSAETNYQQFYKLVTEL